MPRPFLAKAVRVDIPRLFQAKGVRVDMPRPFQARENGVVTHPAYPN
jgi:hypothetical protein